LLLNISIAKIFANERFHAGNSVLAPQNPSFQANDSLYKN